MQGRWHAACGIYVDLGWRLRFRRASYVRAEVWNGMAWAKGLQLLVVAARAGVMALGK